MHQKAKDIQKRYDGFLKTPRLWEKHSVSGLQQFVIDSKPSKIDIDINEKLRLGKYIERLVSFELKQNKSISILSENIQIQDQKTTLGELDCLLLKDENPIHLEIIYKFYVYDDAIGNSEIEHFIGPNKKDALIEKLNKLSQKQLPFLYAEQSKTYLKTLNLDVNKIKQQVYFKAQLFIPFQKEITLKILNQNCIEGFYINKTQLQQFSDCKFYIPKKLDWVITPHSNVNWLPFESFKTIANSYFEQQFSPLCWLKRPNGELKKFFLVWW
ncbi:DUF1853 family protein [Hwangdonia lutea]|uniref:DUF1853 family protein n=1 Tax=Hwangdonia lutea TaxID=3075823 RepID=A0AA97ENM6_9FLAO|nr:DUF1853 family protein [Hwangdonia sp. SCSIO 19198]WOD44682.1 DUF1853 family protein [Hwangdonia sp. SCSIO 19198]